MMEKPGEEDAAVGKGHRRMEEAVAVANVEEGAAAGGSEVGACHEQASGCSSKMGRTSCTGL